MSETDSQDINATPGAGVAASPSTKPSIAGTAYEGEGSNRKPVAGATVFATGPGQPPEPVETDSAGRYKLENLEPGTWEVFAWHGDRRVDTARAVKVGAGESKDQQDLELVSGLPGLQVSGTAVSRHTGLAMPGTVVKIAPKKPTRGRTPRAMLADADGRFQFEGLQPGTWSLVAFHEDVPSSDTEDIVLTENRQGLRLLLWQAMSQQDKRCGERFFAALIVALALLTVGYVLLHRTGVGRIESMSDALVSASRQAIFATQIATATEGLTDTIASIRGSWNAISQTVSSLTPSQKQMFGTLVADVEEALAKKDMGVLAGRLQALNTLATTSFSSSGFWAHEPLRYVEVLLWGLAGILVNLIITTGNYLRWARFYREGLSMHLSQVVTMPLQALVFVLLISQIALTVSVGGTSNLVLDLNNPRILVAVSFLIGSRPWAIWRFIQEAASKITRVGQ